MSSLAVLPGSSVECERGFSNLNHIKGEDRNSLKGDNLRYFMCISSFKISIKELIVLHMPTLVLNWKRQKDRRFTYSGKRRCSINFVSFKYSDSY